jgi:hypothetical protein
MNALWGLKILQAQPFEVGQGGYALDSEGVPLVGAFVIPKPVLLSVGQNYKRGAQVFRVSAGLFFGLVGVKVWPFCFQHAERPAFSGENVIGSPAMTVQFKAHPTFVEEIPAALSELLVDQDARKCLGFGHGEEV